MDYTKTGSPRWLALWCANHVYRSFLCIRCLALTRFALAFVLGLRTFARGLRWKGQWLNSGEWTRLRVLRPGSSVNSSRNSAPIFPVADVRERGFTSSRYYEPEGSNLKIGHGVAVILLLGKTQCASRTKVDPRPSLRWLRDVPAVLPPPSIRGHASRDIQLGVVEEEENERQGNCESGIADWPSTDWRSRRARILTAMRKLATIVAPFVAICP